MIRLMHIENYIDKKHKYFKMHRLKYLSVLIPLISISGCFAPLNSVFDNANMLKKNEFRVGASYSRYYGTTYDLDNELSPRFDNLNNNTGVSLGYGLSEKLNLNGRYESFNLRYVSDLFEESEATRLNYFEAGLKIRLKEDLMAFSVPVGIYCLEGEYIGSIDPRFIVTGSKNKKFDFTIIPKVHILISDGVILIPGVSFNIGLSDNLDKWAVRPEIGFDGYFFFGIGGNVNFGKK